MLVGLDVDGTVDQCPPVYLSLMQALRAAGHRVVILTGCSHDPVEEQDVKDKETYLRNLGLGEAYDQIVVFADPPHEAKAQWQEDNHCDLFIDNSKKNTKLSPARVVLLPWETREK